MNSSYLIIFQVGALIISYISKVNKILSYYPFIRMKSLS